MIKNSKWSVLKLNLFFDKSWYIIMIANSYIQVSNTFIIIGIIAEIIAESLQNPHWNL